MVQGSGLNVLNILEGQGSGGERNPKNSQNVRRRKTALVQIIVGDQLLPRKLNNTGGAWVRQHVVSSRNARNNSVENIPVHLRQGIVDREIQRAKA